MIDKKFCSLLREKMEQALQPLSAELQIAFKIGKMRFDAQSVSINVEVAENTGAVENDPTAIYRANLRQYGKAFNLSEADLGLRDPSNGAVFVGLLPNRPKYAYVFKKTDGKIILYPEGTFNLLRERSSV